MNIKVIGHSNVMGKSFYSSFLLDNILISTPPGILKELQKMDVNIDNINIIIIPHLHGEEYFDLPMIIAHEKERKRQKPLIIIGPKNLKQKVKKLIKMGFNESYLNDLKINFINAETVQNANLTGDYYFTFINIKHSNLKNAYGLIIKNEKTSIAFTAGASICPGLSYMLREVKNCIIDVANNETKNTLTIKEFQGLTENFSLNFFPISYLDDIIPELQEIKNAKIIKTGEQFYI